MDCLQTLTKPQVCLNAAFTTLYTFHVLGGPLLLYVQTIGKVTRKNIAGDNASYYPVLTLSSTVVFTVGVSLADRRRPRDSPVRVYIVRVVPFRPSFIIECFSRERLINWKQRLGPTR